MQETGFQLIQEELSAKSQMQWAEYKNPVLSDNLTPKEFWYRFDNNGHRFYWSSNTDSNGNVDILTGIGITSALSVAFPEPISIKIWKSQNPDWQKKLSDSAEYGTLFHLVCLKYQSEMYVSVDYFDYAERRWGKGEQLKRDLLAFLKFLHDYNAVLLLGEFILSSDPYEQKSIDGELKAIGTRLMSAMDSLYALSIPTKVKKEVETGEFYQRGEKKGQPKKEIVTEIVMEQAVALVDFKSNFFEKEEKSFFESHRYQLIFGRSLVEKHFGYKEGEVRIFNFSPNAWRKEPTYTLHEHVEKVNRLGFSDTEILNHKLRGAFMNGDLSPSGSILEVERFDENATHESFFRFTYEEYILYKFFDVSKNTIRERRVSAMDAGSNTENENTVTE